MHLKTIRAQSASEEEPSPIFDSPTTSMAWQEQKRELTTLVKHLDTTSKIYSMEVSAQKTKLVTNNTREGVTNDTTVRRQALETVSKFKYLGTIATDEGARP